MFKKIPGKAPEAIFYTQSGKELERLNIERFDREELNKMMVSKGIPLKKGGHDEVILASDWSRFIILSSDWSII